MAASPIDKHEELFLFSLLKDLKLRARAWCCEVEVAWEKQKGVSQRCHQGCFTKVVAAKLNRRRAYRTWLSRSESKKGLWQVSEGGLLGGLVKL